MHKFYPIKMAAFIGGLVLATTSASSAAPTKCNESCLLGLTGDYLDALTANDPKSVPFTATVKATENGVVVKPGDGVWKTATSWPYRHTMVDAVTGSAVVLGAVNEGADADGKPKDAFVVVRLKFSGKQISESELMVTRPGEFSLFAPRALNEPKAIFNAYVPADRRASRAELADIAKGYFDALVFGDQSRVAFHPDCNRIENGVQTTNNPGRMSSSCAEGLSRFVYMHSYRDVRIPIIDPARGLVLAITAFDMPEMKKTLMIRGKPFEINNERQRLPRTLFLYELFKVEDGRIRSIEAMMRSTAYGADMGWGGEKGKTNNAK